MHHSTPARTDAGVAKSEASRNIFGDTTCGGTEVQVEGIAAEALDSTEKAAVDPAVAGIAATATAEAVAMEEAAEHYRQRSMDVALDQLQCESGQMRKQESGQKSMRDR